jgi:hypothetical protein
MDFLISKRNHASHVLCTGNKPTPAGSQDKRQSAKVLYNTGLESLRLMCDDVEKEWCNSTQGPWYHHTYYTTAWL